MPEYHGNRLARQQHFREPYGVKRCAEEMATALAATAQYAVAFVGDAELSPDGSRSPKALRGAT